ncbi:MAG TPA: response regulator [Gemmatimonadaceae bacterium]|nr:response regulator [Gemmatimonadaceae bacterium]
MRNATVTVGIVDDDDSIRQSLRQLLRAADFDALTFASAEEFLASPDRGDVDCLIVDVNLPGMSGVALVRALADAGDRTPAVLITARDDSKTLELLRHAAPVPHLRKPFGDEALFGTIGRLLPP